jgi:hypothetical protein
VKILTQSLTRSEGKDQKRNRAMSKYILGVASCRLFLCLAKSMRDSCMDASASLMPSSSRNAPRWICLRKAKHASLADCKQLSSAITGALATPSVGQSTTCEESTFYCFRSLKFG